MSGLDDLLAGVAGFNKPSMASLRKQGAQGTPVQASSSQHGLASSSRPAAASAAPAQDPITSDHIVKSSSSPALAAQQR